MIGLTSIQAYVYFRTHTGRWTKFHRLIVRLRVSSLLFSSVIDATHIRSRFFGGYPVELYWQVRQDCLGHLMLCTWHWPSIASIIIWWSTLRISMRSSKLCGVSK
jgi:hypothetical protein